MKKRNVIVVAFMAAGVFAGGIVTGCRPKPPEAAALTTGPAGMAKRGQEDRAQQYILKRRAAALQRSKGRPVH